MLLSFVVRLVPEQLALGRCVGQVEDVETGLTSTFRDLEELQAFLCAPRGTDLARGGTT